jgi:hypothetical protein
MDMFSSLSFLLPVLRTPLDLLLSQKSRANKNENPLGPEPEGARIRAIFSYYLRFSGLRESHESAAAATSSDDDDANETRDMKRTMGRE